jgi:hypothetical protein
MKRFLVLLSFLFGLGVHAQETPYFVTYSHHMEEPGNLELELSNHLGLPKTGRAYTAPLMEIEYGVKAWWTSELYLEGQSRRGDSTIFTGWRLENRFKPLAREHRINPVLYFEFEDINEASRIQKEVVGHAEPFDEPNAVLRQEHAREVETKLILSSNVRDWNISENFIVEKNLTEAEAFEFGYAFGVSRALSRLASGTNCRFCRENFTAGLELYGGLGSTERFGFAQTAQYIAPALAWQLGDNATVRISPAFGLTAGADRFLLRVGYSYEIRGFGRKMAAMFRGGK